MSTLSSNRSSWINRKNIEPMLIIAAAIFLVFVFPLFNSLGWVSNFTISLWGKYLCYALLAMSVDLLWGYTGLLSLGQALFFALGGYMHGMYLMRMIGERGQYHKPIPDFLVFLGWTKLPSFWEPFASFPFALTMVFLLPGLIAYVFGFLAFRSRIRGVYFSILTQALTYAASIMFFRNNLLLGGNNGFTDFKFILGFDLQAAVTQRALFVASAVTLLLVYGFCRWLKQTKFGLVQQAIRDGENRVLFSGYATAHYKLFVFVLAALIAWVWLGEVPALLTVIGGAIAIVGVMVGVMVGYEHPAQGRRFQPGQPRGHVIEPADAEPAVNSIATAAVIIVVAFISHLLNV